MSSVDHSTADAMKPSISKGYHLGSVNSSLVNLYLTPPFASRSPSCVTPSSRLSAWPYPLIKAQLTCCHRIYNSRVLANLCISHMHTRYRFPYLSSGVALHAFKKQFYNFLISTCLLNVLRSKMSLYTHRCNQCPNIHFMLRQWKKQWAVSVSGGCVH